MKRIVLLATTLTCMLAGMATSHAGLLIREDFDKATQGSDSPINGQPGANAALTDVTGIGFAPNSAFLTYATTLIREAQNFNVNNTPGLPPQAPNSWAKAQAPSGNGGLWGRSGDGSSTNNGGYDSRSWSVRQLTPSAYIDLSVAGTYWVTYHVTAGGSSMEGIGFASGTSTIDTNADFIGFGITRAGIVLDDGSPADNTPYITYGKLGQGDMVNGAGSPPGTLTGGPYYARAAGANALNTRFVRGLTMLGKIVVSGGGGNNVTFSVKLFDSGISTTNSAVLQTTDLPYDPSTITWDVTTNFAQTAVMKQLLLWMNTLNFSAELDGILVSTNYAEVAGLEIFGPTVSPVANVNSITVYAGANVTNYAGVYFFPVDYQWTKNGTPIGAVATTTNNNIVLTLPLSNVTVADSGVYGLVATNGYGNTVSVPATITVLPANPPTNAVVQPSAPFRYQGGSVLFNVAAQGSTPFTYRWTHATTNLPGATSSSLNVTNLQLPNAGAYACIVSNQFGSTTSAPVVLTVAVPVPGSYAAAVVASQPYAYYRLNETSSNIIADVFNGRNGSISDTVTDPGSSLAVTVSNAAPSNLPFPGFEANNYAMGIQNNGADACRLDAPVLNIDTNQPLTFTAWVYPQGTLGALAGIVGARDFTSGWGLNFSASTVDPVTGNSVNQLAYTWPLTTSGDTSTYLSGLIVPTNEWTFVAVVVETNAGTLYVGFGGTLYAATNDVLGTLGDTHAPYNPDTELATTLMLGRDSAPGNAYWHGARNLNGLIDEVAIFNKAISFQQMQAMYQAGAGDHVQVYATQSSPGSVDLSWINGQLFSSTSVQGPYSNQVSGALSPRFTDSTTNVLNFYQVLVGTNSGDLFSPY